MSASRSILVTGATGVVGRRVVPALVGEGHRVSAVGRTPEKRRQVEQWGATPVELDMFDATRAARTLAGHDVVVNLATHMPPSTFRMMLPWEWRENDHVRREGSAALVTAALSAGVRRFVQESFAPMYADGGARWLDERAPLRPARYNRTTLDAEHSAARFMAGGGDGVVLRFAGFYGPDRLLHDLAGVVRHGWSPLPGKPDAYWSCVSHDDAASAVVAALGVAPGTYNVVDDEPLTRRDFGAVFAQALGVGDPRPMPGWLAKVGGSSMELLSRSQRMSNASFRAAAGWAPRWRSAREGLPVAVRALAR